MDLPKNSFNKKLIDYRGVFLLSSWLIITGTDIAFADTTTSSCADMQYAENDEVFMQANQLDYDDLSRTYHAQGNVDIYYQNKRLKADTIHYNSKTGQANAYGHVSLNDFQHSTQINADSVELNKEFSVSVAKGIKALRNKHILATAGSIQKLDDGTTKLSDISFTACTFKPKKTEPLWALTAAEVIDDNKTQDVTYKNVTFNILGTPVLTLPEVTYPRPNIKRRSGILPPELEIESDNGVRLSVPYFYELDQSRDLTFQPVFYTEANPLLQSRYRQKFDYGYVDSKVAFTFADIQKTNNATIEENKFRGSILSSGRFQANRGQGFGFDVNRVTDDTFLRRFDLSDPTYLQSRLFYNQKSDNSNLYVGSYAFQITDGVTDDSSVPFVLPYIDYEKKYNQKVLTGDVIFKANIAGIHRKKGLDTRRYINSGQWIKDVTLPFGTVMTLDNEIRGDIYHTSNGFDPTTPQRKIEKGFTGRLLPRSSTKFSLPLVKRENNLIQVIEPAFQAVIAPYGGNSDNIPNEDGFATEFDATGLFDSQRFYGYDLVETGHRFNSGIRYMLHMPEKGGFELQFGQSQRLKADNRFEPFTGLDGKQSDYVGRTVINYQDYIHLTHRYRLDDKNLGLNLSDLTLDAGTDAVHLTLSHFSISGYQQKSIFQNAEQFTVGSRLSLDRNWHLMSGYRRDTQNNATLESRGGILYTDECFISELSVGREYLRLNDIQPSTSVRFRIRLLATGNDYYQL